VPKARERPAGAACRVRRRGTCSRDGLARRRSRRYLACLRDIGGVFPGPRRPSRNFKEQVQVAKVSPGEFFRQVRAETAKVVWPTRRETLTTALMVVIMTTILGLFFFGVDSAFSAIVQALLGLLS
jgi:preprotein translocase subunit SecE